MIRNCETCPSFTAAPDGPQVVGKNTATPVCARLGIPLSRPGQPIESARSAMESFAMGCDGYGQPRPDKPLTTRARVVMPDVEILAAGIVPEELASCRNCKHMVPSDVVVSELGFPIDLCRAKGTLIYRPQSECKSCMYAQAGSNSRSTNGLELRDEYKDSYRVPIEFAVKAATSSGNTTVEPSTYPTDKPVSDAMKSKGIRAWREVWNSSHTKKKYLPIFDRSFFSLDDQALIPKTGDEEHPELYIDYTGCLYDFATEAFTLNETLVLQGMPGVGKTEFARWVAWLCQMPFRRFDFSSSTEVDELLGVMHVNTEGTYFEKGKFTIAWESVGIIVGNELNTAQNMIRETLRSCTDNSKELYLNWANIKVQRNPFSFFIIAQNPDWDIRNIGTQVVGDADSNRLSVIEIELPPESVERHIIIERCKVDGYDIPVSTLDVLMKVATDLREASNQGNVPFTWGLRQQIKVARKTAHYDDLTVAYRRAVLDFYEPAVREYVFKIINDYVENVKTA